MLVHQRVYHENDLRKAHKMTWGFPVHLPRDDWDAYLGVFRMIVAYPLRNQRIGLHHVASKFWLPSSGLSLFIKMSWIETKLSLTEICVKRWAIWSFWWAYRYPWWQRSQTKTTSGFVMICPMIWGIVLVFGSCKRPSCCMRWFIPGLILTQNEHSVTCSKPMPQAHVNSCILKL